MRQQQNYIIKKNGAIKGGTASYSVDFETGEIKYDASAIGGFLFFTKTYAFSGTYKVDPELLKSANLRESGELRIETLKFFVTSVHPNHVEVDLEVEGKDMKGEAIIDTSQEFVKVDSMLALARVAGFEITLDVVEAKPMVG